MALCQKGSSRGQRQLFDQFITPMTRVAVRYLGSDENGKDVLAESFVKVFDKIHSFEFRGQGSLRAWITKIVVNECLMVVRRRSRYTFTDVAEFKGTSEPTIEADIAAEELFALIRTLPDGCRLVFNLYVIEGYSHEEISKMMIITPGTSRSQLAHAKKLLKEKIDGHSR